MPASALRPRRYCSRLPVSRGGVGSLTQPPTSRSSLTHMTGLTRLTGMTCMTRMSRQPHLTCVAAMNSPRSFLGYRCSLCGAEYAPGQVEYICPRHGDSGNLDIVLDLARPRQQLKPAALAASRDGSLWRYLPLLPVADPGCLGTPLRAAGWTPLYHASRLGAALGLSQLFIKDDGRNPTASFKDRASVVVVARAREIGAALVVTASTGNAGAALAGMAGAVGLPAVIFAPESAPPAKVAQLLIFGARVLLV